ncbi:MAG: toxin-antitoxin system antitoxin subunit [Candidatus Binataceae bacterium]
MALAEAMQANVFSSIVPDAKTTTIRLDTDKLRRIGGIAQAVSRSRTWVLNQAIERYLDYEEWFVSAVNEGLKEAESGKLLEHSAVASRWKKKACG